MLSVLIPVEVPERGVYDTLASLVPGVVNGAVRDVAVLDYFGDPALAALCDEGGCSYWAGVDGARRLFSAAIAAARTNWILIVPPGLVMVEPWLARLRDFFADPGADAALFLGGPRQGRGGSLADLVRLIVPVERRAAVVLLARAKTDVLAKQSTLTQLSWRKLRRALPSGAALRTYRGCVADVRKGSG